MRALQIAATERGARLWRNNVGVLLDARGNHVRYGLATGSSDLIGLTSAGVFLSVEVKSPRGRTTPEQDAWLDMVRRMGGVAGVCRSVEDLEGLL